MPKIIARAAFGAGFCSCKTCILHINVQKWRFKCQALLDESAVLAAMAYVDLNPVRAALRETLEESAHTSARRRLAQIDTNTHTGEVIAPIAGAVRVGHHSDRLPAIARLDRPPGSPELARLAQRPAAAHVAAPAPRCSTMATSGAGGRFGLSPRCGRR